MNRYLFSIDSATDVHVIVATDSLADWSPDHVWGMYDTSAALDRIGQLIQPDVRSTYSTAESLLHLVITDSPGRSAFWGVPNVGRADPVLMARADDLEVMLHREPDGALGLLYFAEWFYFSDDGVPTLDTYRAASLLTESRRASSPART